MPHVMMLMCSKGCGESIGVTQEMIDEAVKRGKPVDVQHEVCPNETTAPKREFRVVIAAYEIVDGVEEKLAQFGGTVEESSFKRAIPGLAEEMSQGWNRVIDLADMVDADYETVNATSEPAPDQQ